MSDDPAPDVIELLAAEPASTGLFTDFDGTLAAIVPDPDDAVPFDGVVEALREIAGHLGEVVVVSGRPVAFLADRLGAAVGAVDLFGLHGLERWQDGRVEPVDAARGYGPAIAEMRRQAEAAGVPGLVVEDKGLGLTLHWRRAEDPATAAAIGTALAEALAAEHGLSLRSGKASIETVLPLGIDKGTVVAERGARWRTVGFIGDDVSDLCAFDALDSLEADGAKVVRMAVTDAPDELVARADLVLDGPGAAARFLEALAKRLAS